MQLNYQRYPEEPGSDLLTGDPVIIIPGLFGSTANWRSFARKLSADYLVYVIDQRNHGYSPHADSNSYADMVADLLEFIDERGFDSVALCGHSMGGKTAMAFSLLHPARVAKLAVLDIAPATYTRSHAPFVEAMMQVDLQVLKSRLDADTALKATIPDMATRMFLLQSLTASPGHYRWRLNLAALHKYMPEIMSFPDHLLSTRSSNVETVFINGALSDYVQVEHKSKIKDYFTNVTYVEIADAGHWLHAEQPKSVLVALLEFLKNERK